MRKQVVEKQPQNYHFQWQPGDRNYDCRASFGSFSAGKKIFFHFFSKKIYVPERFCFNKIGLKNKGNIPQKSYYPPFNRFILALKLRLPDGAFEIIFQQIRFFVLYSANATVHFCIINNEQRRRSERDGDD